MQHRIPYLVPRSFGQFMWKSNWLQGNKTARCLYFTIFISGCYSSGAVRLVLPAENASQHRAHLLLAAPSLRQLRAAGSCGARGDGALRGGRARLWPGGAHQAARHGSLRQHVHPVHVQYALRLRRPGVRLRRTLIRRDLLGHQQRLRGRLPALALALLHPSHEQTHVLGKGNQVRNSLTTLGNTIVCC